MNYFLIYVGVSYCYGAWLTKFLYKNEDEIADLVEDDPFIDKRRVLNLIIALSFILSPVTTPINLVVDIIDLVKRKHD